MQVVRSAKVHQLICVIGAAIAFINGPYSFAQESSENPGDVTKDAACYVADKTHTKLGAACDVANGLSRVTQVSPSNPTKSPDEAFNLVENGQKATDVLRGASELSGAVTTANGFSVVGEALSVTTKVGQATAAAAVGDYPKAARYGFDAALSGLLEPATDGHGSLCADVVVAVVDGCFRGAADIAAARFPDNQASYTVTTPKNPNTPSAKDADDVLKSISQITDDAVAQSGLGVTSPQSYSSNQSQSLLANTDSATSQAADTAGQSIAQSSAMMQAAAPAQQSDSSTNDDTSIKLPTWNQLVNNPGQAAALRSQLQSRLNQAAAINKDQSLRGNGNPAWETNRGGSLPPATRSAQ